MIRQHHTCKRTESRKSVGRGFLLRDAASSLASFLPLCSPPRFLSSVLRGQTTGDELRLSKFWLRVCAGSVSHPSLFCLSLLSVVLQSRDLALTNWILGDSRERLTEGRRRGRWTERQGDKVYERERGRMHGWMDE